MGSERNACAGRFGEFPADGFFPWGCPPAAECLDGEGSRCLGEADSSASSSAVDYAVIATVESRNVAPIIAAGSSMSYAQTPQGVHTTTRNLAMATSSLYASAASVTPDFFASAGQTKKDYEDPGDDD